MEETIELYSRFETIDFESGELVNVLDSAKPVIERLDTARWLIDRLNGEIEQCKDRKKLWNERENVFKAGVDKIRESIKDGLINEGLDRVKTVENLALVTDKIVTLVEEAQLKPQHKLYDISIKNLDFENKRYFESMLEEMEIEFDVKDKVESWYVPKEYRTELVMKQLSLRRVSKN